MPDEYRVLFTNRAAANLESIFDYISQDSPQNAAKVITELIDSIDRLAIFPYRYAVPRAGPGPGRDRAIRSMPVRPFLVNYRIDENNKSVYVLSVRHGARNKP